MSRDTCLSVHSWIERMQAFPSVRMTSLSSAQDSLRGIRPCFQRSTSVPQSTQSQLKTTSSTLPKPTPIPVASAQLKTRFSSVAQARSPDFVLDTLSPSCLTFSHQSPKISRICSLTILSTTTLLPRDHVATISPFFKSLQASPPAQGFLL